jgi:cystathionine beta-lyase
MFGLDATRAAYEAGEPWRLALMETLEKNRAYLRAAVAEHLPGVRYVEPEGTYLAWLDCRGLGWNEDPQAVFLEKGRVALNPGPTFGPGGDGFVRLNFGCPLPILEEAIKRMAACIR